VRRDDDEYLWDHAGEDVTQAALDDWGTEIERFVARGGRAGDAPASAGSWS